MGELPAGAAAGLAVPVGLAAGWLVVGLAVRMVGPGSLNRLARTTVVVVTAAVFAAVGARFGFTWAVIVPLILAAALVALSAIDLCCYRLPDPITFGAFGASLAAMAAVAPTVGGFATLPMALAGSAGFGAVLWAAHEVSPRGMGFGDVKLGFVCGLHLGWTASAFHAGWSPVVGLVAGALLLAGLVGVTGGLVVAWLRRRGHQVLPDPAAPLDTDPGPSAPPDTDPDPAAPPDHDLAASPDATPGPITLPTPDLAAPSCAEPERPNRVRPRRLVHTSFPFGPALAVGTMVAVLFSEALVG